MVDIEKVDETVTEDQLSSVFGALADPVRRAIVARLFRGDATVNELAEPFDISLQAVSKHLKVLESAGLITRRREGQRRPCQLNPAALDLSAMWLDRFRTEKEAQFQRLDALLRQEENES